MHKILPTVLHVIKKDKTVLMTASLFLEMRAYLCTPDNIAQVTWANLVSDKVTADS